MGKARAAKEKRSDQIRADQTRKGRENGCKTTGELNWGDWGRRTL